MCLINLIKYIKTYGCNNFFERMILIHVFKYKNKIFITKKKKLIEVKSPAPPDLGSWIRHCNKPINKRKKKLQMLSQLA